MTFLFLPSPTFSFLPYRSIPNSCTFSRSICWVHPLSAPFQPTDSLSMTERELRDILSLPHHLSLFTLGSRVLWLMPASPGEIGCWQPVPFPSFLSFWTSFLSRWVRQVMGFLFPQSLPSPIHPLLSLSFSIHSFPGDRETRVW